jgi:hypothetical protein
MTPEPTNSRRLEILLLCDYRPDGAATVCEHIDAIARHSHHRVHVLSMLGELEPDLDLNRFDAVIIHYSLVVARDEYLGRMTRYRLRYYHGLKAIFIQDEYRWVNDTVAAMRYLGVDLLFTCVPGTEVEKVYPVAALPATRKINVLTGYVPEYLTRLSAPGYAERPIDVGYRARRLPAWYGDLGQEKWRIAERFAADAPRYGLHCDLSCAETDRLYGNAWVAFVQSCRAVLGVESGASVFDFSGLIQNQVERFEHEHPHATFSEIRERFFSNVDGAIRLNQISPRCFEAAALRTLMILYEGDYSGLLQPWRHYVPLRKDHGNMDEVVAALRDEAIWERITTAAFEEVALNPDCSYRAFVAQVDGEIAAIWSPDRAAREPPYTAAEFAALAARHAAVQQRHRATQARTDRWYRTADRLLFSRLREPVRDWVFGAARRVLHGLRILRAIPGALRRRLRILRACLPGMFGAMRADNLTHLFKLLRGGPPFGRLVHDMEVLRAVQRIGSTLHSATGRAPFQLSWARSAGRLRIAAVEGFGAPSAAAVDTVELLRQAVLGRCVHVLEVTVEERWGLPALPGQHVGELPAINDLLRHFPAYAWQILVPEQAGRWFAAIGVEEWAADHTRAQPQAAPQSAASLPATACAVDD